MAQQTVDYVVTVDIDEEKRFLKICDLIDGVVEYDRASKSAKLAATDSQQLKQAIALVRSESTFLKPSLFNEFNSFLLQIEQRAGASNENKNY